MANHALNAPAGAAKSFSPSLASMVRPCAAGISTKIRRDWERALKRARQAEQARIAFEKGPMRDVLDRYTAGDASSDDLTAIEDAYAPLAAADGVAGEKLCCLPAPDMAAVRVKVSEMLRLELFDCGKAILTALHDDLARL